MKTLTMIVAVQLVFFTACGKNDSAQKTPIGGSEPGKELDSHGAKTPTPQPNPTASPSAKPASTDTHPVESNPLNGITYQNFAVLREFASTAGENDRAALFLVLPSQGVLTINSVTGPNFLKQASVGILDADKMKKLFANSSTKMAESEKAEILKKFQGATFLYFENYEGQLCDQASYEIDATSTLLGKSVNLTFTFEAAASRSDDCFIYSSSMLETSFN